jgi:energy-coupling factor transporter ATP-binding protein EcfA2
LAATTQLSADEPAPVLVRFDGVSYRYPSADIRAIDGISAEIRRGEIVGVIGATGAGKTTLCLAMNGIVPQFFGGEFFGTVTVAGLDAIDVPTSRLARHVGMVFEDPETQITATTVIEEAAFALENLGVPSEEMVVRVSEALHAVGLAGMEQKHPANLSGGQKQRLSIASALALSPDLIVLDEPTSQLDPVATGEVFALLRRLNSEKGVTIIVASHASEELAEIAHRIIVLDGGRIVAEGPPENVFARTEHLRACHVRPPDIVSSWKVLENAAGKTSPVACPVTLDAARKRITELTLPALGPVHDVNAAGAQDRVAVLAADGLTHVYPDGTQALRGIDLKIGRGEFVAIAGRNGSGKSTLVRHFLGLLSPTSGCIALEANDVADMSVSDLARRIGYVSQNAHQQIFCDSVAKEVGFAPTVLGRPADEVDHHVNKAIHAMNLSWAVDRHPMSLSRGDRLRVAIAAVLALEPKILIFDEPTTGQDWKGASAILDILSALNHAGATVVLITHHLYLLPGQVERLVMLDGGRIIFDGPMRDAFYDRQTMNAAGLEAPQTVRFVEDIPSLATWRPLGANDLARIYRASEAA